MLDWSRQFSILAFLDSNSYRLTQSSYECLLAAGSAAEVICREGDGLSAVQSLHEARHDWMFGHISYDYKNLLEPGLNTRHIDTGDFPLLHFFIPQTVCYINKEQTTLTIETFGDPGLIYADIVKYTNTAPGSVVPAVRFVPAIDKEEYIETIKKLRTHIAEGDCYEINFCSKADCSNVIVDPLQVFNKLNALSPAPFAACYRLNNDYLMCASPERYIRKDGRSIMSQPIKGTARRDKDAATDQLIKEKLRADPKERAENVMIVDLVRNDLSRCCETGSVKVDELFGIYSFPQVHQMISTISGRLRVGVPLMDPVRYSFPMGSMTGAPKYKVMQLIDNYEQSARGLFSGTVGYITPDGDFDFNVVIRSLFYNSTTQYLSYQTGGAITYDSDPGKEWDELRLKAWAMERIFT
jgi:para-aminobenzoate synthetase component 1